MNYCRALGHVGLVIETPTKSLTPAELKNAIYGGAANRKGIPKVSQ